MNTQTQHTAQPTAPDSWRDIWTDPDTVRINARRDEIQHDTDDMAAFYAAARLAVS
jgi:hypothetical protein